MLSISLKDSTDVKYYEDVIKLSVDKSNNNFPTKVIHFYKENLSIKNWSNVDFSSFFQKIFSVGDIICFDSPLALTNEWTSSDESIIQLINTLGKK